MTGFKVTDIFVTTFYATIPFYSLTCPLSPGFSISSQQKNSAKTQRLKVILIFI